MLRLDLKEGAVIGTVTINGDDEFELRLSETKKEEPSLKFKRSK